MRPLGRLPVDTGSWDTRHYFGRGIEMSRTRSNHDADPFIAQRWTTLAAIVCMAFFVLGNTECGADSEVHGGVGGSSGSNSSGTSASPTSSGSEQSTSHDSSRETGPEETVAGENDQTGGEDVRQPEGSECSEASHCGAGEACAAGQCVRDGAMRITMIWDAQTDFAQL